MPLVFGIFSWHSGIALLVLVDAFARAMPIGHALGRLGCLSYGCCYGRPTRRRLAITYRNPLAKAVRIGNLQHVRLHPAAFYEAVLDLGILLAVNAAVLARGAPRRTFCPGAGGLRPRPLRDRVPEGQRRSHLAGPLRGEPPPVPRHGRPGGAAPALHPSRTRRRLPSSPGLRLSTPCPGSCPRSCPRRW